MFTIEFVGGAVHVWGFFSLKQTIFRKGRIDRYYWKSDYRLFNEGFLFPYENFIINVIYLIRNL